MTNNVENNPAIDEGEEQSPAAKVEAVTEPEVKTAAEPEAAAESENDTEADGAATAPAADETADAGEANAAVDAEATTEAEPAPEPEPSLPLPTFAELGLPEPAIEAARELGYAEPTFAQAQIIPVMSLPHDAIVCGAAGADKAAAYLLGLLSRLPHEGRGRRAPRALIVVPTRQVAQKLALAAIRVARATDLFVSTVYGGAPFAPQVRELKDGTDVLIATPGRLCELMTRDAVDLSRIKTLVVDEADIVVDLGFALDVNVIANATPRSRRTLMFCASSDPDSLDSLRPIVVSPEVVNVSKTHADKPTISQYVVPAYLDEKPALLEHLLDMLGHERIVMYAHTKTLAQSYAALLAEEGISTGVIHSDSLQAQRNTALADFNCGRIDVLVTTDEFTAANVARASHIINLTLPDLLIEQASRVEQAGHLDAGGCIVSIVDPDTCCLLRDIEAHRAGNISVMKVEGYDLNYDVLDTVGRRTSSRKAKSVASKGTVLDEEGNVKRYKGELDWIRDLEAERRAERRERETLERLGIIAKDDSAEDEQRDERRANGARNGRRDGVRGDGRGRRHEGDGDSRDARSRHREGGVRTSRFEGHQREDNGQRSLHPDSADLPADVRDGGDIPAASFEDAPTSALQAQGAADVDAFERDSSELAETSVPSAGDKEASVPSAGDKPSRDADDEDRNSREERGNRDDRRNREERSERRFDNKRSGYKRDGERRGGSNGYKRDGGRSGGYRRDEGGRDDERRSGYRRDDNRRTGGYQRDGERYGQGDGGKRGGYRSERSGGYRRDDRRYDGSFKGKRDGERQGDYRGKSGSERRDGGYRRDGESRSYQRGGESRGSYSDYRSKGGSERRDGGYQRDEGARQSGYRRDGQGYRSSDDHRQREDHRRAEGADRQNVRREGHSGGRSDNRGGRSFNRNNARGSYQRDYRKRDDGSFNGGRDGDSRGGYRDKDGNSGKGGYRGYRGNGDKGGYRKDRSNGSRGGQDSNRNYRSGSNANRSNSGYRGNGNNGSSGGYRGNGGNNHRNGGKGGYRGGSQNRGANGNSSTNS